jgi:cellulose synthase/poly-beta-1,6-N-acetylglucosamine synthase-like glycosyltransferase
MGNYQLIEIIFWISILAVSHTYLGYPLILLIISRFSKRNEKPCELEQLPSLAIFLSVFNEESIIKKKIENCFSLDFPQHLLEVAIASDGSSDSTNEILKFYKKKGVKTFINDLNLGKNATINKFFPKTKGDIIVFTDANSMLAPDALLNLARRFSNPRVGCVGGNLKYLHDNSPISKGEGLYFRYENIIRKFEGKMGRMVGANGAIYAIRRNLFVPVPSHVPNDFFQPLVVLKKGFDSVYEESAVAYEKPTQDKKEEFQRRTRMEF